MTAEARRRVRAQREKRRNSRALDRLIDRMYGEMLAGQRQEVDHDDAEV